MRITNGSRRIKILLYPFIYKKYPDNIIIGKIINPNTENLCKSEPTIFPASSLDFIVLKMNGAVKYPIKMLEPKKADKHIR